MATVIDSLIVTLGLDPTKFTAGANTATATTEKLKKSAAGLSSENDKLTGTFKKTREEAASTAKELSSRGDQGAEFFSKIKSEALGLFAVMLGGKGLTSWVESTTKNMADLGRSAHNLNMSAGDLQQFRNTIERNGGSADAAVASLTNLQQSIENLKIGGDTSILKWLQPIGAQSTQSPMAIYRKFIEYASAHKNDLANVNMIGQGLGFDQGMINEAEKGLPAFDKDQADSLKEGVPTDKQIEAVTNLQQAMIGLGQTFHQIGVDVLTDIAGPLTTAITKLEDISEKHPAEGVGIVGAGVLGTGWLGGRAVKSALRWLGIGGKAAADDAGAAGGADTVAAAGVGESIAGGFLRFILRRVSFFGALASLFMSSNTEGQGEADQTAAFNAAHAGDVIPPTVDNRTWAQKHLPSWLGGLPAPVGAMSPNQTATSNAAMKFFVDHGMTPVAAAGLVGNLTQESGLNPHAGYGTAHLGIAQWSPERQAQIEQHFGKSVLAMGLQEQLAVVQWEQSQGPYKAVGQTANMMKTIPEAAAVWDRGYESPGNYDVEDPRRAALGERAARSYQLDHGLQVDPGLSPDGTTSRAAGGPGGSTNHTETHTSIGSVTVHTQATDATGIARGLNSAIAEQAAQGNYGLGY